MKRLMLTSTLTVFVLIVFYGCSGSNPAGEEPTPPPKMVTANEMANKNNPYDEQGRMYTGFLNGFTQFNGDIGNWDVGQLGLGDNNDIGNWDVGQIAAFNGDIGNWDVGQLGLIDNNDIGNWDVGQVTNLAIDYYNHTGKDTTHTREVLNGLIQDMGTQLNTISLHRDCWVHPEWCKEFTNPVELLDPNDENSSYDRTIKYITALKKHEAEIKEKTKDPERKGLLIASAIARHAAAYWHNAIIGDDQPFPWDSHHVGYLQNALNINTLGATTAFNINGSENVGVPTAILTLYILNKYGRK